MRGEPPNAATAQSPRTRRFDRPALIIGFSDRAEIQGHLDPRVEIRKLSSITSVEQAAVRKPFVGHELGRHVGRIGIGRKTEDEIPAPAFLHVVRINVVEVKKLFAEQKLIDDVFWKLSYAYINAVIVPIAAFRNRHRDYWNSFERNDRVSVHAIRDAQREIVSVPNVEDVCCGKHEVLVSDSQQDTSATLRWMIILLCVERYNEATNLVDAFLVHFLDELTHLLRIRF